MVLTFTVPLPGTSKSGGGLGAGKGMLTGGVDVGGGGGVGAGVLSVGGGRVCSTLPGVSGGRVVPEGGVDWAKSEAIAPCVARVLRGSRAIRLRLKPMREPWL